MDIDLTVVATSAIWAVTIGILVLVAISKFETALRGMVQRVKKLGPAEFDPGTAPQLQTEAKPSIPAGQDANVLIPVVPGSVLEQRVGLAREALMEFQPDVRLEQAIRAMASMGLLAFVESINFQIYGSQLAALQTLNSRTLSISEIQSFYEAASQQHPEPYRNYPFNKWLAWMTDTVQLVVRKDDTLSITPVGREFLRHLVERGYSLHRML